MQNVDCDHVGHRVYVRRTFVNGSIHYGIQCLKCLSIVKDDKHGNRPWLKAQEIPAGKAVYEYIDPEQVK